MALTVGSAGLAHSIPAIAEAFDLGRAPSAGAERPLLSSAPLGDPFTVTGTGAFERIAVATSADWVGSEIVVAPTD
ncbi:hypothetical protein [Tessaracoccus massiliensis]|uniref:hypothetical protein n=1 Tax=Tessaracoccus massiliensis TaxID=1522311 RepID=UPI00058C2703|nr:hypothetical protein [Tessaracoccus massiliensis]